ncbi:DUF4870 domain-containing protein [Actinomadura fibrosa]|uniref:DUF4870 domain-containing protein n=1 Tax=Actinomadura fibrosa TaxID=111802 RepID=A0ABW2Y0V3_9ACTN|nr:DUF4870 domain-containing protein [Actinomadura fibrosa]
MTEPPSTPPGADDQPPPHPSPYGQPQGAYGPPPGTPSGEPPGGGPHGGHPGGHYDPSFGYGPPGVPQGPPGMVQEQDKTWAIFTYVGMAVVGFLAPLIIYFVKKNESGFIRFHAAQALNFQITLLIHLLAVAAVCVPVAIAADSPAPLIPLAVPYLELVIGQWVFLILGAVKAGKAQYYRFPTFFCFRMIR